MKRFRNNITFIIAITGILGMTACEDWFNIKPETELVSDDFWQTKGDVESAVAACYRALEEPDVMERLITWGEVRSDNVQRGTYCNDNLSYILNANVDATNAYTSWGAVYSAINYCNTVLAKAPGVRNNDPDFKQGELNAYIAEATTLRALCYFYLVRTFKDVPYITQPYDDDTRPFQIAQTNGDDIIDSLLNALGKISDNYAKAVYSTTASTKGRITQKALWTLMADMYLWRNNYDKSIEMCNRILATTTNPLQLETPENYNRNLFGTGNSAESIFELQFDPYTPDYVVNEMYGTTGGRSSWNHLSASDFSKYSIFQGSDLRSKDAYFSSGSNALIPIKKYVSYRKASSSNNVSASDYVQNANTQHWIIYRLPDVYLIKAEALVERNAGTDLEEALAMVGKTYERANPSASPLIFSNYNTQDKMRELVFDERQREFLFEGKRYFDILRRVRREGNVASIVSKYLLRKYVSQDEATVTTRLNTLNALYMPINKDELKVNKLLKQNPFYATSSDIEQK